MIQIDIASLLIVIGFLIVAVGALAVAGLAGYIAAMRERIRALEAETSRQRHTDETLDFIETNGFSSSKVIYKAAQAIQENNLILDWIISEAKKQAEWASQARKGPRAFTTDPDKRERK